MSKPKAGPAGPDLGPVELFRYLWRQLTSMRTALVLLLLLALAAIPGSIVPQQNVDSLAVTNWRNDHPSLAPIYDKLGLFSVYQTPWFAAIYILLTLSLVGCILPRLAVYAKAWRAEPPNAPRNLSRLPAYQSVPTAGAEDDVLDRATSYLKRRRYRVRRGSDERGDYVAAERGYLREAGNLLFHLSILVVLVGFAAGGLFGYKGGAIVMVGGGFANDMANYDDFDPGSLFDTTAMDPFSFTVDDFDVEWLTDGPAAGQARKFVSHLTYQETPTSAEQTYDLRVNHPLKIGSTEVFLIGHGYAPVITVRDGNGDIAYSGPTIFLPVDQTFRSFGVVKVPDAKPGQIGLSGELYPSYAFSMDAGPYSYFGDALDPKISMGVYTGDLGLDDGTAQGFYSLDTDNAEQLMKSPNRPFLANLGIGETAELPDGLGSVTFDGLDRWNRVQISRQPGKLVALAGVSLALAGLLMSLFIRPRRVWVRLRPPAGEDDSDGDPVLEIAGLDRSGNGGTDEAIAEFAEHMQGHGRVGKGNGAD